MKTLKESILSDIEDTIKSGNKLVNTKLIDILSVKSKQEFIDIYDTLFKIIKIEAIPAKTINNRLSNVFYYETTIGIVHSTKGKFIEFISIGNDIKNIRKSIKIGTSKSGIFICWDDKNNCVEVRNTCGFDDWYEAIKDCVFELPSNLNSEYLKIKKFAK